MAWTANRTWTTGELVTAAIMNTYVRDNLDHLYGSVSTFSPTCTQSGSVTLTTATGRYVHVGYKCHLHIALDFSGTGTGGNNVVIGNVPAAIAPRTSGTAASSTADLETGTGFYFDSGTAFYTLVSYFLTSSTLELIEPNTTSGNRFGTTPATAIAAADALYFNKDYETASASA